MSRPPEWTYPQHLSFPRVSGDEPCPNSTGTACGAFSPRERGWSAGAKVTQLVPGFSPCERG